jgi:hypothetical protein
MILFNILFVILAAVFPPPYKEIGRFLFTFLAGLVFTYTDWFNLYDYSSIASKVKSSLVSRLSTSIVF